jgi:hypothetical protein
MKLNRPPPRPLSEQEKIEVARKRAEWITAFGEDDDMIRRLYEAGLIEGWRSIVKVERIENGDHQ